MRARYLFLLLTAICFTIVATGATTAAEPPKFLTASGQEVTFNVVDPGTVTCIGGVATGDPFNPCVGSRRVLLKHQVVQTMLFSPPAPVGPAVPLLAGVNTISIDCSLDGNLKGSCWGTFEWKVDAEATWDGVVSGSFDFSDLSLDYQMVGRGFGGAIDGMQLHYDVIYPGGFSFVGEFAARVHVPKS
ncbi:MAG: hypothetical protein ACM3JH_04455 [Acidithiobacillales bacterium]